VGGTHFCHIYHTGGPLECGVHALITQVTQGHSSAVIKQICWQQEHHLPSSCCDW
jgi:hypothetical protein